MKSFTEALRDIDTGAIGWHIAEDGRAVLSLPSPDGGEYTVEIEPLLFGQYYVAIYEDGDLMAAKVPVRPGGGQEREFLKGGAA